MIVMVDKGIEKENLPPEKERLIILGKLASGIMHDINNILATIQGYATLLMLRNKDDQSKQYLDIIQRCVCDGREIIKRIKKINIKADYNVEIINIKEQIETAIMMTRPIWYNDAISMGKSINVVFNRDDNIYIKCNENEFREIMVNIIINSVDAIKESGNIIIDLYKKDSMAVIEVNDTGCGIDQDLIEKIFDPFFTTKGDKGTGLGLSVVKELVEKMNGTIEFKSIKGYGSSVIIKLPISEEINKNQKTSPSNKRNERDLNILIVDDQAEVGEVIKEMIMALGNIKASLALNSGMAFDMMKKESYDLIITDMVMPKINGVELIRMAKKIYPNSKYVIMTGYVKDDEYIKDNAADYILNKPFTLEEIQEMIYKLYMYDNKAV